MPAKVALSLGLAALFPAASYAAIRLDAPLVWLGALDCLLLAILFIAVSHDARDRNAGKKSLALGSAALLLTAMSFWFVPELLVYMPAIAISLLLARLFHSTLAPGKEPIITRFARIERNGNLPEELRLYTRRLTWAWTLFFMAMTLECLILAALAPIELYLLFANTLNYLFVVGFLAMEYSYRRIRYRHHPHPSLLHLIRAIAGGKMSLAGKD
jgi:uncharacterized membrane protein